jgi:SAM-dependent methyltransferase
MGVARRLAYTIPPIKTLLTRMTEERDQLLLKAERLQDQRDTLQIERNELAEHCLRLDSELAGAHSRERSLRAECERVLKSIECERDELRGHCHRLEEELAERLDTELRIREQLTSLDRLHHGFVERATRLIGTEPLLDEMRRDWDSRASLNALHFTNTERSDWDEEAYAATGEQNVLEHVTNDLGNICQGANPTAMRVLEIGCGAGRMTKPLAQRFGEVHAVDISAEMIRTARERLAGVPNAFFHQNNGMDLRELPSEYFDFALSFIVFQHIPSKNVIESYIHEVHRVLKPGRLFKFQAQGESMSNAPPLDTWLGACYTRQEMAELAARHGFELRYAHGEGTQLFWLWFFKK